MMYVMYMMVRKQLYIEAAQDLALKKRAKALGMSEAEVVRAALDAAFREPDGAPSPPPGNARAIEALLAASKEMAQARMGLTQRWTREELYDEREGRWVGGGRQGARK